MPLTPDPNATSTPLTVTAAEPLADRLAPWGLAALLFVVVSAVVAGWRYFPGFSADPAWYLQVALRVSRGEVLFRDVAWAYGPLPAQALATLFRWGGPDAAWASLINAALTIAGVLLAYSVTRSLLSPGLALLVTAFAALAGSSPWYSLLQTHYYVYTQAIAWGGVASLAALAAALRWQQSGQSLWLLLAGLATGLAMLSKPEFGLTALAASGAALAASRSTPGGWSRYLVACAVTIVVGFGLQAWSAGLGPVWRGYTGYDQLLGGSTKLWGTRLGDRRMLLGGYAFWLAVAALWAKRRWPRRQRLFAVISLAGIFAVLAVGMSYLFGITDTMLVNQVMRGDFSGISAEPVNLLLMVSLPWAPLLPLLLGAGWLARRRALPPVWWVVWSYAVASSLRFLLTGYANSFAVAPALAVFWVWIEDRLRMSPGRLKSGRRIALAVLGGLAVTNLLAQVLIPNFLLNGPRVWIDTALGPVRIAQTYETQFETLAAFVDQRVPAGAPIFATGWAAQWYLLTEHPNPTKFDVVFTGLGASGPDAEGIKRDLLASPPAAIIVPTSWQLDADGVSTGADDLRQKTPAWWQSLQQDYVDQTPPGLRSWRVFLRQPGS
ncbi:MAG TPA: hypothetical protein VL334_21340 [Anaerolineae bacterium]|nr:hypothetical protein [Anaerolineae bacterium]